MKKRFSLAKMWDWSFDYINENVPERIQRYGLDCRKIGADIYLDDRAKSISEIVGN